MYSFPRECSWKIIRVLECCSSGRSYRKGELSNDLQKLPSGCQNPGLRHHLPDEDDASLFLLPRSSSSVCSFSSSSFSPSSSSSVLLHRIRQYLDSVLGRFNLVKVNQKSQSPNLQPRCYTFFQIGPRDKNGGQVDKLHLL